MATVIEAGQLGDWLKKTGAGLEAQLVKRLFTVATKAFAASQHLVPVATGTLKSSGTVGTPERDSGGWYVDVGYGGAASDYALFVHEDMTKFHKPPTRAKFLEIPALAAVKELTKPLPPPEMVMG